MTRKHAMSPLPGELPSNKQARTETKQDNDVKNGECNEEWKTQPPYSTAQNRESFDVKWTGKCHCGQVQYQLSRERPLAAKFCHCSTCQRLHAAPFQWAAIFHKTDVHFLKGSEGLVWYNSQVDKSEHHLPCKVYCNHCRTAIMDEGRKMVLLFPTLIEGIRSENGREIFKPQSHMFYKQRVLDFRSDGVTKWAGLENDSSLVDDDGLEIEKPEKDEEGEQMVLRSQG